MTGPVGSFQLLPATTLNSTALPSPTLRLTLRELFPGYRCLVDDDVLTGAVAIDEAALALQLNLFKGSEKSFFVIAVVKDVLRLLHLSSSIPVMIPGSVT